jgi:hypothetical protein
VKRAVRQRRGGVWLAMALALSACASGPTAPPAAGTPPPQVEPPPPVEPEQVNAFVACRQPARQREILLDTASRRLHQTVCGSALWFDGLFGERNVDVALDSHGRLEVSTAYSEFTGWRDRVRFDIRIKLPAMQERLSAFAGLDDEDDFVRDRSEGQALRTRTTDTDRDEFLAGLGYVGVTTDAFQSDFKVGVRSVKRPKAFVQNRFSYIPYSHEHNRVLLRITPFWNNRDRGGLTTSTSFDHVIAESYLLRWGTVGTLTEVSPGVDWRTAVVLYQNLTGARAVAYESYVRGATGAAEPLNDLGVRVVYREPFWSGSLFGELVMGYSWPRDDPAVDRAGAADLGVGVEVPFARTPR